MATPGFTREELDESRALATTEREYRGLEMAVAPAEAKRRLQAIQAFVQSAMVRGIDYGVIPGTDKPSLYQPGAQKLAELYGLSHTFYRVEAVKDWEKGFFYFEYECKLSSRRDGSHVGDGIGSCNSRESKYADRWVFKSDVPSGVDISKLKSKEGTSKKGNKYTVYQVPNPDPYSIVNTLQKMAAKRAYIHAVIAATRSSGLFTQDVEDLPPEAFGEPAHDADTGEVSDTIPAPTTSKQLTEMHLERMHEALTLHELQQAIQAAKSDEGRIAKGDMAFLRAASREQKDKIVKRQRNDTEPSPAPAPDSLKDAVL